MNIILLGVIAVTLVISFIELINIKKAGYNCSPLAVMIGMVLMWILVYPFYIVSYREKLIGSANERGETLPIILGKKIALGIYLAFIGLFVISFLIEYAAQ